MRKSEIKSLVALVFSRGKVMDALFPSHGIPDPITLTRAY
jgi:hypothetical protein